MSWRDSFHRLITLEDAFFCGNLGSLKPLDNNSASSSSNSLPWNSSPSSVKSSISSPSKSSAKEPSSDPSSKSSSSSSSPSSSSSSTSSSHPPSSVADPEKLEALKMDVIWIFFLFFKWLVFVISIQINQFNF